MTCTIIYMFRILYIAMNGIGGTTEYVFFFSQRKLLFDYVPIVCTLHSAVYYIIHRTYCTPITRFTSHASHSFQPIRYNCSRIFCASDLIFFFLVYNTHSHSHTRTNCTFIITYTICEYKTIRRVQALMRACVCIYIFALCSLYYLHGGRPPSTYPRLARIKCV